MTSTRAKCTMRSLARSSTSRFSAASAAASASSALSLNSLSRAENCRWCLNVTFSASLSVSSSPAASGDKRETREVFCRFCCSIPRDSCKRSNCSNSFIRASSALTSIPFTDGGEGAAVNLGGEACLPMSASIRCSCRCQNLPAKFRWSSSTAC